MTEFEPVAIIGRGCVFPGAFSPEALWQRLLRREDFLSSPTEDDWQLSPLGIEEWIATDPWAIRGGYIRGFDSVFDPALFRLPADEVAASDPLIKWTLHAARSALSEAGVDPEIDSDRAGVILGNLSLPSRGLSTFAESVWTERIERELRLKGFHRRVMRRSPSAAERFMSGRPAELVAQAFGLKAGTFALDAACASSLYAVRLACDWLHQGRADLMLAGAVNGADPLFLHTGFRVLRASSRTGQSRPFHRNADGLVPTEGVGLVALKRLSDAVAASDNILGVIRGVGLSNDGGGRGFLVPAMEGQVDAMQRAYRMSGVRPEEVSFVECHATGTAVGDATELASMREIFPETGSLKIGSSKSNWGHPVTASGMASLLKILSALEARLLPPNINVDDPLPEAGEPAFHLLTEETAWRSAEARLAGISSFGFGGNNAHLIVEEWRGQLPSVASRGRSSGSAALAIVGIGAVAGTARGKAGLMELLDGVGGDSSSPGFSPCMAEVHLDSRELRYPPKDLLTTLPQQLALLEVAREAMEEVTLSDGARVGVFAGMECDAEIARHIAAIRGGDWVRRWNRGIGPQERALAPEALSSISTTELTAAGVVGILPNMVANRLSHFFRLTGPSFSLSGEELSGHDALAVAADMLRSEEIDAAIVGASELACEPVHAEALRGLLGRDRPGDAAVALVLRRLDEAVRAGQTIYAVMPGGRERPRASLGFGDPEGALNLESVFGHAHAATGLLQVAVAAMCCYYGVRPARANREGLEPWLVPGRPRTCAVSVRGFLGRTGSVSLQSVDGAAPAPLVVDEVPGMFLYAGSTRAEVIERARNNRTGREGRCRLVVVAQREEVRLERCGAAVERLQALEEAPGILELAEGAYYSEADGSGELAFVFTGAAASYRGMGKPLLLAFPDAAPHLPGHEEATTMISPPDSGEPTPFAKLVATSFLSRYHAELSTTVLNLKPDAVIGLSAGETNALLSMGAWQDSDSLFNEFRASPLFATALAAPFTSLQAAWPSGLADWTSFRVLAPLEQVRKLLDGRPYVYLTLIHTQDDCVISGNPEACRRVIEELGAHRAVPMAYDFVIHCPVVRSVRKEWRRLHRRPTQAVPGIRFYTSSTYTSYRPEKERCADALVGMAENPVDFPRLIEAAWKDGVRVFVEQGPRSLCAGWIREILGDRESVAVSMDDAGRRSLHHFIDLVARLLAYGCPIDERLILNRLQESRIPHPRHDQDCYTFPAHPATLTFSDDLTCDPTALLPYPPELPRVIDGRTPGKPPDEDDIRATGSPGARPLSDHVASHAGRERSFDRRPTAAAAAAAAAARLASAHHRRISGAFGDFIRRQSAVHQQFLRGVVRAEIELAGAMTSPTGPAAHELSGRQGTRIQGGPPRELDHQIDRSSNGSLRTTTPLTSSEPAPEPTADAERTPPSGPSFSRTQLEALASEKISSVFGPLFEQQDHFRRQVRMPEPPLLLADRVLGIEGEAGSMGTGTVWTATDVAEGSWYLHDGYMPFGLLVEAGQADLLLISWLGADFLNRDERVYRLLGCEMTFHGRTPAPGDLLEYEIHIDGHATDGDVRLFFFRYDCYLNGVRCLTMRNGQAGFFSDEELRNSKGVLWSPETAARREEAHLDPAPVVSRSGAFSAEQVSRFAEGDVLGCFGSGFELSSTHVRTPRIPRGMMQLLHEVTLFDPSGGPAGRGYLRAETPLTGKEWYFPCHFKGDPAMPGTLMMEGCFQAIAFFLTASGFTLDKDGYRFEIVPERAYKAVCRGQATSQSRLLVYEIFIEEVIGGPTPEVTADVLVTVDGLKAFVCRGMGVRLIPDWPLTSQRRLLTDHREARPVAKIGNLRLGYAAMLACAWGRPSEAFGPLYEAFDGARSLPRLPGPPYLFLSRVTRVEGEIAGMAVGTSIEAQLDIPSDAWYFTANGTALMPFCAILEAALQPCGWLTAYIGVPLQTDSDLHFRNLDGKGILYREIRPGGEVLTTKVTLTALSRMKDTFIESFTVECSQAGEVVYSLETVFGHFLEEELAQQVGLPAESGEADTWCDESSYEVDLRERPAKFFDGPLQLPDPPLLMLDRITGYWPKPNGEIAARFRGEKSIDPADWFFKAHFYQDPVQPGSLGVEAMIQLLQAAMIELGLARGMASPRFEPIRLGDGVSWKYRGQVLPTHECVTTLVEVTETGEDEHGVYAIASASTVVDGRKIYRADRLGMRIVEGTQGRRR